MTGDRVTLNTVTPQQTVLCRICGSQLETLAHVLGQCSHTKIKRIGRHNGIRDFVATRMAGGEGVHVIEEPTIRTSSGPLKPDLVLLNQTRVHVVDVTVRHEDKNGVTTFYVRPWLTRGTALLCLTSAETFIRSWSSY
jgi:hypothetical protein